tara:strand:- start:1562 stop:1954 length:393 start_codon:yes stop_codon:yes gene_type:complete
MNKLAIIFSLSIIFLISCSSTPNNDPVADIVGENKIGYVQISCMQNPDNGPRMVSRQKKHEYLNKDDYFDCVDRTSASIEAQNEKEKLNRENQQKLVPKKEEEIKLEEEESKIKCEPDIGGDTGRYYKCS